MKRLCALALTALVLAGCNGIAMGRSVEYTEADLANAGVDDHGVWESTPWSSPDAPWLPYTPRVTATLHHTLGYAPRSVLVYISFDDAATTPALAAGDLAEIYDVSDTTITVHNDTNNSFFFRVVAF